MCPHLRSNYYRNSDISMPIALINPANLNRKAVKLKISTEIALIRHVMFCIFFNLLELRGEILNHITSYTKLDINMNIHYISPYRTDKNIGRALNEAIIQLNANDDDWIVHTDQDVCFLRPDSKAQIQQVMEMQGSDWDVLGCLTNRLASPHQLYQGRFNDDSDIRYHIAVANERHAIAYGQVVETNINIAACLMAFRVSTWREIGGFNEGSIRFDSEFTDAVQARGGKLGIMQGVYIFHLYRMWSDNPVWEVGHLS